MPTPKFAVGDKVRIEPTSLRIWVNSGLRRDQLFTIKEVGVHPRIKVAIQYKLEETLDR